MFAGKRLPVHRRSDRSMVDVEFSQLVVFSMAYESHPRRQATGYVEFIHLDVIQKAKYPFVDRETSKRMSTEFPASVDVDYADGEGEGPADYPSLQHKIEKAIEVTKTGLEEYENPAVMWTGGERLHSDAVLHQPGGRTVRLREADRRLHRPLPALRRDYRLCRALGRRVGYRRRIRP